MRNTSSLLCLLIIFVLCLQAFCGRDGFSASQLELYSNSQALSSTFTLLWDGDEEWIHLALIAKTHGWVALGIAEQTSGSMPGADMLVGWVDDRTGEVIIQDRWAASKSMPTIDACPNWLSDGGFQNDTHTVIAASRLRDTGDQSDRSIPNGPIKVVWAHTQDGTDGFAYHGAMRHATSVEFFKDEMLDQISKIDPSWEYVDLRMNNYIVPQRETVYACQSFNLTQTEDKHIVRIEPLLDPATASMVHHFLLHVCEVPGVWDEYASPDSCTSPISPLDTNCNSPIFGWGVGGGPLYLPTEAGYRLGTYPNPNEGMRYFILEVHYNSPVPSLPTFRTDTSGVRIYYTNQLRPYDAGMMVMGDPFVSSKSLPPAAMTHVQATCSHECTKLWSHPIVVFADFLHMHSTGSRMWSTIHPANGSAVQTLRRIEFYDYNFQELGPLLPTIRLDPGDRIETHCIFNTYGRTQPTDFGPDSADEMCMEFLAYYPALRDVDGKSWAVCGYANTMRLISEDRNVTICGSLNFEQIVDRGITTLPYKLEPDVPGGESSKFGLANDERGSCPDPITRQMISPPLAKPPSTDRSLLIWAIVVGSVMVVIVLVGLIVNFVGAKTQHKPHSIPE